MKCPRCRSKDVKITKYRGTKAIICRSCDFDERDELDTTPSIRTDQKAKRRFSPYKTGGSRRTEK